MPVNTERENLENDLINKLGITEEKVEKYTNIDYCGFFNGKYMDISLAVMDYETGRINQGQAISNIEKLFG